MKDHVQLIAYLIPTLKREAEAFMETRTAHDRMRVDKTLAYLDALIADWREALNSVTIVDAGAINDEAKTRE